MLRLFLSFLLLMLALVGCSHPTAVERGSEDGNVADEKAIRAVSETEFAAVEQGDIAANLAVLGDDVVIMPPNQAAIYGKSAFATASERFYSEYTIERFDHSQEELVVTGDWAFERWTVSMTVASRDGEEPVSEEVNKGIHIYHKESNGNWKIVRDIWNSDKPVSESEDQ